MVAIQSMRNRNMVTILASAVLLLVGADRTHASCNVRPAAFKTFPSTLGSIETPIVAPDRTVRLLVTPACDGSAGFEPVGLDNAVTVTFEPPGGGAATPVAIDAGTVAPEDCTLPGGRCRRLSFPMPDTTALLPPYGLAGPASILVEDAGLNVVADISELFLPTLGCDRFPEELFEKLTILPTANVFADVQSGAATELSATVDGGGNLLIPLDYWDDGVDKVLPVAPGSPIAVMLTGHIDAFAFGNAGATLEDQLLAQSEPSEFLRSFTLDGRPLPPLLRVMGTGEILGTSDARESVIRVTRNDGGGDLYDFSDRLFMDRGPIVLTNFSFNTQTPLPLDSLRSSAETVAFTRSEAVEGVDLNGDFDMDDLIAAFVNTDDGTATNTGTAVTSTFFGGFFLPDIFTRPIVDVGGDLAAFLEFEADQSVDKNGDGDFVDSFLNVFDRDGTELTFGQTLFAAAEPEIDRRPFAVSDGKVFYRTPGRLIQNIYEGVDGVTGFHLPQKILASADGLNVYVGVLNEVTTFMRDPVSGELTFVATGEDNADGMVMSPDDSQVLAVEGIAKITWYDRAPVTGELVEIDNITDLDAGVNDFFGPTDLVITSDGTGVYVCTFLDDSLVVFDRDVVTGTLTFNESIVDNTGPVNGLDRGESIAISPDDLYVYVLGQDDNGIAIFSRNPVNNDATFVAFMDLSTLPDYESSYDPERIIISPDGNHLYVSVGNGGPVIVGLERDAVTGLLSFGTILKDPNVVGFTFVDGFGFATADSMVFNADGSRMYVADSFRDQVAILSRDPESGQLRVIDTVFQGVAGVSGINFTEVVGISSDGAQFYAAGGQDDGMAVFATETELAVFDAGTLALRPTQVLASNISVADGRAAFLVSEAAEATDLNGDLDMLDEVVEVLDVTTPGDVSTVIGIAGARVKLSESLLAITVPEGAQDKTDRNGDGDLDDDVLAVLHVGDPPPMFNTGLVAEEIDVSGNVVVFAAREAANGADLNGDGDLDDRVLRIYYADTNEVVDTFSTVADFLVAGDYVAYTVYEVEEDENGPGCSPTMTPGECDLNGDGDATDFGIFVYDLVERELIPVGESESACTLLGCPPGFPYKINPQRKTLHFLTSEASEGEDLNGDNDTGDLVLQQFSIRSRTSYPVQTLRENGDPDPLEFNLSKLPVYPQDLAGESQWFVRVRECDLGYDVNEDGMVTCDFVMVVVADVDRDGIPDDFDSCVESDNADGADFDADGLGDSACDPNVAACPPTLTGGCRQAPEGKTSIQFKQDVDDTKDVLKWKWSKGEATTLEDFADPVNAATLYSLCIYDESGELQPFEKHAVFPGGTCGTKPCWKAAGTKGYKYSDKAASPNGIQKVLLKAGEEGKPKVVIKGKGPDLDLEHLPITLPATVQLFRTTADDEICWQGNYVEATKNDATQFKAKDAGPVTTTTTTTTTTLP